MSGKTVNCAVCGALAVKKDLCQVHYDRFWRNGHFELVRPADWGQRSNHPLWERWKNLQRRVNGLGRAKEWDDFWRFVEDVSPAPEVKATMVALRDDAPIGPGNWAWKEVWSDKFDRKTREGRAAYMREWYARNPAKGRQQNMRRYGLGIEEYDAKAEAQGFVCAICKRPDPNGRLHIDHNHTTRKVRDLLCKRCNTVLGLVDESVDRLRVIIGYLERHNEEAT